VDTDTIDYQLTVSDPDTSHIASIWAGARAQEKKEQKK
jgi:hypothetical protein